MGETSKTPEQIAAKLSPAMRRVLMTGASSEGAAKVYGHTNTIIALIERGLITIDSLPHRGHRWTKLGREVARHAWGEYGASAIKTMDELHELAIDEDAKRFPVPERPAHLWPTTLQRPAPGDRVMSRFGQSGFLISEDGDTAVVSVGIEARRVVLSSDAFALDWWPDPRGVAASPDPHEILRGLSTAVAGWAERFGKIPPASVFGATPRSAPRPAIVDKIINGGPVDPGPGSVDMGTADFNALRDYLLHESAGKEFDSRVVRRAHYEALRAVLGRLDAWRSVGNLYPEDAQQRADVVVGAVREMVMDAAIGLGVPTAGLIDV